MNSPVFGWSIPLYLGLAAFAAEPWSSLAELRKLLPEGKAVAHWTGPDAAFLAVHVAGSGVHSIVALKAGARLRFDGKLHAPPGAQRVSSLDVEGALSGSTVVLFHSEAGLLRGPFSFDTPADTPGAVRILVTGVAPGVWEIWRNGWVVDTGVVVRAGEAVLFFEGRPGAYFLRRLG